MIIPAGETLISDGENLARVRCGNRLSPVVAKPVAATDPAEEELDTPEFIPPMLAELVPGDGVEMFPEGPIDGSPGPSSAPTSKPGSPYAPILPPLLGPGVPRTHHSTPVPPPVPPSLPPFPPPVKTPEPGSLSLFLAGAAFVALLALITLRRNGSS